MLASPIERHASWSMEELTNSYDKFLEDHNEQKGLAGSHEKLTTELRYKIDAQNAHVLMRRNRELTALSEAYETITTSLQKRVAEYKKEIASQAVHIQTLNTTQQKLEERVKEFEEMITFQRTKTEGLEKENAQLKQGNEDRERGIEEEIRIRTGMHIKHVQDLQRKADELEEELVALRAGL
jgi:chromosome segregation ATPase